MNVTIQGAAVPALGFGTWKLTGQDCVDSVLDALEVGYRHVDSAQDYGNEAEVGRGIRESGVDREQIFLVSKIGARNFPTDKAEATMHESLRKLGVDYIDLMLLHWPNDDERLHGEALSVLAKFQEQGKLRHVGVSNFSPQQIEQARSHATIFCNQIPYDPYRDQSTLIEQARELGHLITAYTPLARGRVMEDPTIRAIAEAHGKNPAQVTLRWLIQQPNVCTIPKAASPEHRRSNFDIFDFELTDEQMQAIAALRQASG